MGLDPFGVLRMLLHSPKMPVTQAEAVGQRAPQILTFAAQLISGLVARD
jgi:hypothetical protein